MPEGLLTADGTMTAGVDDDPDHEPPASAEAPKGWAWQRKDRAWAPRQRGPVKWTAEASTEESRPGQEPDHGPAVIHGDTGPGQSDPEPSWLRDDQRPDDKPGGKLSFGDVSQQVKDDIAGFAGLVGAPLLAMLQQADPYCGTILAQSFENIVDATLPLICRSSKIVKYFSDDKSDWLLWGKLALALKPFAQAVIHHHILGDVEVVRDAQGQVHVMPRARQEGRGDHLQPPAADEYNYAA